MKKNVKVGINENEFNKFCQENGLNPEHKLSKIRFASTKDEDAKEMLDKIESGEVKLDDVDFIQLDVKEFEKDFSKGLIMLFEGIANLTGNKEKLDGHPIYKLNDKDKVKIACALMTSWSEDLIHISDCITEASFLFDFNNFLKNKTKDGGKNDKEA